VHKDQQGRKKREKKEKKETKKGRVKKRDGK